MARRVLVIGLGPGGFGQLTLDAVDAMNSVDVFLVAESLEDRPDQVWRRSELIRRTVKRAHRILTVLDPVADRPTPDSAQVATYRQILSGLPDGEVVGFLVWGDPALYESVLQIIDALRVEMPMDLTVIPGVSAPQLLAAAHEITLDGGGNSVHLTTGRRLLREYRPDLGDVVVLDDDEFACRGLVEEFPDIEIFWGAYLGTPQQVLVNGGLAAVLPDLMELRARLVEHHGWIQETYLLRAAR